MREHLRILSLLLTIFEVIGIADTLTADLRTLEWDIGVNTVHVTQSWKCSRVCGLHGTLSLKQRHGCQSSQARGGGPRAQHPCWRRVPALRTIVRTYSSQWVMMKPDEAREGKTATWAGRWWVKGCSEEPAGWAGWMGVESVGQGSARGHERGNLGMKAWEQSEVVIPGRMTHPTPLCACEQSKNRF